MLDSHRAPITGALSQHYLLARQSTATHAPAESGTMTRMTCPNMGVEHDLLSMITDKTLRCTINDGRLVVTDDKEIALTFDKTD